MAEIHAGTAVGVDRAVFPAHAGNALAAARLDWSAGLRVIVELA